MFLQNTPDIYCDKLNMNSFVQSHWPTGQNKPATNNYISSGAGTATKCHQGNPPLWTSEYNNAQFQPNTSFGASHHFIDGIFPQQNPVQHIPVTPQPVSCPVLSLPRPYQNSNVMAKKHRAQITFVSTQTGNFKAIVKRKRKRTAFTTEQVEALEEIFKKQQYITREDRQVIVDQLHLNDKAVKNWFQNRRLKDKKGPELTEEEQETEPSWVGSITPNVARLDHVESQINQKTDANGYVTLDDGVMKDLFNVIDDFLTNDKSEVPVEDNKESDCSPIYEPISPASIADMNDEDYVASWTPTEPNESLQRLFDVQTILSL